MKKVMYILWLLFISAIIFTVFLLINMINVDKERIGGEYVVIEDRDELSPNDSHGSIKNYSSNFSDNIWTTNFDFMNSTGHMSIEINPDDTLKINNNVDSGAVWVKITQGSLARSEIQKIQAVNGKVITADLSQWEPGEIQIWLVVKDGKNGEIQIEHMEKESTK